MPALTGADLADLGDRLRARRAQLVATLRERLHQADDEVEMALFNYFAALDDPAAANQLNDFDMAQLSHELAELRALDMALARVHGDAFGHCANCGGEIALDRLRAQPSAQLCLGCQEEVERNPRLRHASG